MNHGLIVKTNAEHHVDKKTKILNLEKKKQNDYRKLTVDIDK